jgi:ElaB/YqjD/DUF883 family membrane-anchored ribosome-binding protein
METLRERLEQLHAELEKTGSVDERSREALEHLVRDIQELLEESGEPPHPSLRERLSQATRDFEESHPTLSATLGRVADALSNLGI